ncbi:MAG: hypothetical protein JWQ02_226 [Capsulimonas sp.]|jgi:hypothetical protein|nr:hypothetical protein [Capsulimonas sp.]
MWPFSKKSEQKIEEAAPKSSSEISQGLRKMALTTKPEDVGLTAKPGEPYGILMEMGFDGGAATLMAMAEGTVSIYYSNGGALLGGVGHETVRNSGLAFVAAAREYVRLMQPTQSYPFPESKQIRFYALTPEGVYTYQAKWDDLGNNLDPLSPLFHLGDRTLTEFRLIEQKLNR